MRLPKLKAKVCSKLLILGIIALCSITCKKQESIFLNRQKIDVKGEVESYSAYGLDAIVASDVSNGVLSVQLNVRDKDKQVLDELTRITIPANNLGDAISHAITQHSLDIAQKISFNQALSISYLLDEMASEYAETKDVQTLKSLKNQGVFIANSLIKATFRLKLHEVRQGQSGASVQAVASKSIRDFINSTDYQLPTTNPAYSGFDRGMSAFVLNEDILLNVAKLRSSVEREDIKSRQTRGGNELLEVLKQVKKPVITLQEL